MTFQSGRSFYLRHVSKIQDGDQFRITLGYEADSRPTSVLMRLKRESVRLSVCLSICLSVCLSGRLLSLRNVSEIQDGDQFRITLGYEADSRPTSVLMRLKLESVSLSV